MIVECPICKTPMEWSNKNAHRPFCSDRCKLIDLGAWADGSYNIPDDEPLDPNEYVDPEENND